LKKKKWNCNKKKKIKNKQYVKRRNKKKYTINNLWRVYKSNTFPPMKLKREEILSQF
jgi:hypothetical protein